MTPSFSNNNNNSTSSLLLRLSQNPICWRFLVLFCFLAVLYIAKQQEQLEMYSANYYGSSGKDGFDLEGGDEHHFFAATSPLRCVDADDTKSITADTNKKNTNNSSSLQQQDVCLCGDPLVASPRRNNALWTQRHQELKRMALQASQDEELEGDTEVVFLGDSIVEHFSGTRQMGTTLLPQEAKVFREFATTFPALALGCSGDTSTNLLYHLQHGLLPEPFVTQKEVSRVYVVVIGTNDLTLGCSKRTTLSGILQVVQTLHRQVVQRGTKTKIVVHGLFPRQDEDERLNQYWSKIVWINKQLKTFTKLHNEWIYFDINNKLLERHKSSEKTNTDATIQIQPGMFLEDGLHPSVEGYELWAKKLKKLLVKVFSEGEEGGAEEDEEKGRGKLD